MKPTLSHTFASTLPELTIPVSGAPAPSPSTWMVNADLANALDLTPEWIDSQEGAAFFTGQNSAGRAHDEHRGVAQLYAGHQFGGYSPILGDGRAMLLGETTRGTSRSVGTSKTVDLHLKGSGPNRYSRGDGFATLDQCLREFLMGEFMHAVHIPTTRALAVVTTGRNLHRDSFEHGNVLPGAVLTRVASSHIRVGSFQFAKATGGTALLERLLRYAASRHDPDLIEQPSADLAREFLVRVIERQAALTASWMLVGFVHGVMNTDNMLVSGETIDYGPCAFLDGFDPGAVFSSIDHAGRYAYGKQPGIAKWNLARLADALLPLFDSEQAEAIRIAEEGLARYDDAYNVVWLLGIRGKLGLEAPHAGAPGVDDTQLTRIAQSLFDILTRERLDYTGTFVTLTRITAPDGVRPVPESAALRDWAETWLQHGPDHEVMRQHNPIYIPRNHHVQHALDEVLRENREPFEELLDAVSHPTRFTPEYAHLETPGESAGGTPGGRFVTYCGT